jgi:hypothetical protein
MTVGLEIYDASGTLVLNGTDRVLKLFGYATVNGANGSHTDGKLSTYVGSPYNGTAQWIWVGDQFGAENWMPNIYISGSTLYWNYGSTPGGFVNAVGRIFYGTY